VWHEARFFDEGVCNGRFAMANCMALIERYSTLGLTNLQQDTMDTLRIFDDRA